jgi:hypothetical protein
MIMREKKNIARDSGWLDAFPLEQADPYISQTCRASQLPHYENTPSTQVRTAKGDWEAIECSTQQKCGRA